jgi:hypothetical protein
VSEINYQALRLAAENATPGEWCADDYHGVIADAGLNANYYIASCSGPDNRANKRFIAAANPATVLALLDELEAAEKRIAEQREYYEGVIADGSRRIAELEAKIETSDKLQDSAFRHGLQHGFSYGQTNDQARYEQCIAAYSPKKIADGIITKVGG